MAIDCWQVNLQAHFGGGEVYTRFLTRALQELGCKVHLLVSPAARFWPRLGLDGVEFAAAGSARAVPALLPAERCWVLTHGALPAEAAAAIAQRHLLCGIAHMPLFGRNPASFAHYHLVIPVSAYVLDSLKASPARWYEAPLYGVADLARTAAGDGRPLEARSPYDWDRRKVRDRLLAGLHPLWDGLRPRRVFERREGIVLGIVSRLTPIKQFPRLFSVLAPVLARHPRFKLEIFGSGGYASVRDLRRALGPMQSQVRFWGQQDDVAAVYGQLDYLLAGLPEKEALGLNVIEAQACGVPVLAVAAPPFTETVVEGETGWFYRDPREDGGADFERLLQRIEALPARPDPRRAKAHLARFSYASFCERVAALLARVETESGARHGA